jgi:hypothetical protein
MLTESFKLKIADASNSGNGKSVPLVAYRSFPPMGCTLEKQKRDFLMQGVVLEHTK